MDQKGVRLRGTNIGLLANADDIVLLMENEEKLKPYQKLTEAVKYIELEINRVNGSPVNQNG